MDPQEFQQNWISWDIKKELEIDLSVEMENKQDLINLFEEANIYCIASREGQNEVKFYFYCHEQTQKQNFLFEIKVVD